MMIAILASCSGYGAYVPALRLSEELNQHGIANKVFVYEFFYESSNKNKFIEYRKQFHESFRFAQMATKMPNFDSLLINLNEIINSFIQNDCNYYIVFTGTWLKILEQLDMPKEKVLCLRPDTVDSPSWNAIKHISNCYNNIWLIGENRSLPKYKFCKDCYSYNRTRRIVLHGGGWGINTFIETIKELYDKYELYTIHSTAAEARKYHKMFGIKTLYTPIEWIPESNEPSYPPLIDNSTGENLLFHTLLRSCCAVISKPGGGTCLDALTMKVPPIFLQSMANHEKCNMINMTTNYIGINFNCWKESNYSYDKLLEVKENLISKLLSKPYLYEYINRNHKI